MSKSSASSTKPAWHVNLHAHSLFHLLLLSLSQSDHLLHHHNNQHCFLLTRLSAPPRATAILLPPHLSPLSALIHPTHPAQHGEGASHHAVGHSAGVHYGASPAGQAKHAGALHQLLPHPHLPAAHLHHCLANVSGWDHRFPSSQWRTVDRGQSYLGVG